MRVLIWTSTEGVERTWRQKTFASKHKTLTEPNMATKKKHFKNHFMKAKSHSIEIAADLNLREAKDLHQQGQFEKAQIKYLQVLEKDPQNAKAIYLLGLIAFQNSRHAEAIELITMAINIRSDDVTFHITCGDAFFEINQFTDALSCYNRVIYLDSKNVLAHYNKGRALKALEQFEDAILSYNQALELNSKLYQAHFNLGNLLKELNRFEQALGSYDRTIALEPTLAVAHLNRGVVLRELNQVEEALESFEEAIKLKPDYAEAFSNRGLALNELNQLQAAVESYEKAITLNPNVGEFYYNLGNTLKSQNLLSAAIECYEKTISINPKSPQALYNLGNALVEIRDYQKANSCFAKAYEIQPNTDWLMGIKLHTKLFLCDWENLNAELSSIKFEITQLKPAADPFKTLVLFDDPQIHLLSAQTFIKSKKNGKLFNKVFPIRSGENRLRIGYYSADLYYHPASIWLAEQLENHDKSKVDLYAFCLKSVQDPMRDRLEAAFDHWIDVQSMSDLEVTKLSRELGIDIAIDLNGHTADSRTGIFAARAAPIQVSHLGFPGSMGAEYIDYMFFLTPSTHEDLEDLTRNRQFIAEKIAYVPSNFTYDRQRQLSDEPLTRAQFGLPETGFVFTCQNGCQKLLPEVFDVWMEILKAVPGSVLWLLKPNETAVKNLIKEANARGVDAKRLIFTEREVVSIDQERARIGRYLASYKLADLFLDTWPYNAGTTAVDALRAGVPVLTKQGKAPVARMAADALRGIEVPELITKTQQEYKLLAIELAQSPDKLKLLKDKIQRNRLTTALFDPVANTRHIENAYLEMNRRYQAGLEPADLFIKLDY
jgi:predicted O-linked N-acetylglucosamine transferase (SPINDLY family)